jgi:hypothetical protein
VAAGPASAAEPTLFFAPDQLTMRAADWGRAELDARLDAAWQTIATAAAGWLTIAEHLGPDAATDAYLAILDGTADPTAGHILSLHAARRPAPGGSPPA